MITPLVTTDIIALPVVTFKDLIHTEFLFRPTHPSGNTGSKPNSFLASKHNISNTSGDITIPLGTKQALSTTTTGLEYPLLSDTFTTTILSEQELPTITTPLECISLTDTTTTTTSSGTVTNPSFDLVSESIEVSLLSVNNDRDVVVASKTITTTTQKIKKSSKRRKEEENVVGKG